jgi:hypothetical protein
VIIRDATPADAVKACEAIRASITELCIADHNRNPEILRSLVRQGIEERG